MRRPFLLQAPRISDEGKLATIGDSFAQNQTDFLDVTDYHQLQTELGIHNWQDLSDYFADQTEGFLSPLVLHIKSYNPLIWHEVEQCVIWEVVDNNGNSAFLRLYWEGETQNNLEELRFLTKRELEIVAITVQPVRRDFNIDLLPTTIWIKTEQGIEMFYLDFDQFPRKKNSLVLLVIFKNIWLNVSDKRQCITVNLPLHKNFVAPFYPYWKPKHVQGENNFLQCKRAIREKQTNC
ncbi:hypothetical protein IC611_09325 [Proteus mirabilis]